MSIKNRIEEDLKGAMRAKDSLKVTCLRMVKAAIQNKEIDARAEIAEDVLIGLLSTLIKQRKESVEQFQKGNRNDLAQKEALEIAIIEKYLPSQLSREEILKIIEAAIKESQAKGPQDMGKVMKSLMPKVQGRADGKLVSDLVKEKLK